MTRQPDGKDVSMKKIALIVAGLAVLALPPAASALKPTKFERAQARAECISERGTDPQSRAEFRALYRGKRPLLVCIRIIARQFAQERAIARAEARTSCQQEKASDPLDFRLEYPGGLKQCIALESAP
jgi:hypothetical protein